MALRARKVFGAFEKRDRESNSAGKEKSHDNRLHQVIIDQANGQNLTGSFCRAWVNDVRLKSGYSMPLKLCW